MKKSLNFFLCVFFFAACSKEIIKEVQQMNPKEETIRYLALGDSYTLGQSVTSAQNFPNQLADTLKSQGKNIEALKIIAQTGWTTTNLIQAIAQAKPDSNYTFVSLLIGVNNFYQNKDTNLYYQEFEELLNSAIVYAGGKSKNVVVLSIPDYGYSPYGQANNPQKIAAQTDQYNRIAEDIAANYSVQFIDITPLSRSLNPKLITHDNLHPSAYQYQLWVRKILASRTF